MEGGAIFNGTQALNARVLVFHLLFGMLAERFSLPNPISYTKGALKYNL